jgi:hypothetical protein
LTYKEIGFGGGKAVYTGSFRGNKRDGYGEMTWGNNQKDGEIFKGIWHNDQRVKGYLKMIDGSEYDGGWKGDVFHGFGRLTFKPEKKGEQGVVYEGNFINGVQDREGKLLFPNGDTYFGQTLDNKR